MKALSSLEWLITELLSAWRAMWVIVMFDLPTMTKKEKRRYTQFRKLLLEEGFSMMQFSIYGRHHPTREKAETKIWRITQNIPLQGEIRILRVTEAQFARMEVFSNYRRSPPEREPPQLELW